MKTALITGANKGIGHEVARQLGSQGFRVFVGARNSENGQKATKALRKRGVMATFIPLDVSDSESVGNAVHLVSEAEDHLDVLVNNAGVILEGDNSITRLVLPRWTR
jgi:NAD(P)-dependent dehydrogenase (short-subunit alcohol dehydrogenase family)